MRDPMCKYFQVGVVAFMAYPGLLRGEDPGALEVIRKLAADDYFGAIELTWIKDANLRAQAVKLLRSSHMAVCYGAQPRLLTTGQNANSLDESERRQAQDNLFEAVDEASELGASGLSFLSGKWSADSKEAHYNALIKTTSEVCAYAKPKGIRIELEVFDFDIAKKSLIGPAPLAAHFAADMRAMHDNFGLLVDLSHIPMCYETPAFTIGVLKPYITHFHIGNTVCADSSLEGYGDDHQRFGFPGSANDVPEVLEFLRVLKREGFFRPEAPYVLSFEVKPWHDECPEAVLGNAKRVLNRAWALLED